MKPTTEDRRQYQRHTVENSIMVNHDGVFQLVYVSKGGFCFKCPPYADVLNEWVSDILTPIGDLKDYPAERKWCAVYEDDNAHMPSLMKVGIKFGQLTKDQNSHLAKLIGSISDLPTDWKIDGGDVL